MFSTVQRWSSSPFQPLVALLPPELESLPLALVAARSVVLIRT